jgi:effector-binding domain-containing protein
MMETEVQIPVMKHVKPANFLFFRTETTVNQLADFLPIAKDLQREAVNYNLRISGPVHWHYFGFMGDDSKPFTLEVAIPVDDIPQDYDGSFHFKRTEPFPCLSMVHEGGWQSLPETYGKLMREIMERKLQPIGNNRELYINADFRNPEANVTEVQIGVAG